MGKSGGRMDPGVMGGVITILSFVSSLFVFIELIARWILPVKGLLMGLAATMFIVVVSCMLATIVAGLTSLMIAVFYKIVDELYLSYSLAKFRKEHGNE